MARLGEFTIDGGQYFSIGTSETDYLFDATAEGAAAAADFVHVSIVNGTNNVTARFDCQGDGGSGALLASGTGTSTPGNVVWSLNAGRALYLPASLLSTAQTTRHGRIITSNASTLVFFQFCSWV